MNNPDQPASGDGPDDGPSVTPLDLDAVRTVQVGTAIWAIALLALLPFHQRLADDGHTWWLWTCVAGLSLGFLGVAFTTRRRRRIRTARQASY